MNGFIYEAKPYAVAAIGAFGIATGSKAGIVCGLVLIGAGLYIRHMRKQSRGGK